jgi:hypothetical protein
MQRCAGPGAERSRRMESPLPIDFSLPSKGHPRFCHVKLLLLTGGTWDPGRVTVAACVGGRDLAIQTLAIDARTHKTYAYNAALLLQGGPTQSSISCWSMCYGPLNTSRSPWRLLRWWLGLACSMVWMPFGGTQAHGTSACKQEQVGGGVVRC